MLQSWIKGTGNIANVCITGVNYDSHVQNFDWMGNAANGEISETIGKKKRMKAE
ncbi:hypothetical protein [Enterococcus sp. AZ192]|uniref:hypothetical protein n=1 Tax=unclassified Enterococcus TaxID=2608891 RepID=UPI003D28D083